MCFGPIASFSSGGVLAMIGAASLRQVRERRELPYAALPLLFSMHQLAEGVIWLDLESNGFAELRSPLTTVYLGVALCLWPVYVSASIRLLERNEERRKIMAALFLLGLGVASYLLYFLLTAPSSVRVINHCLYYDFTLYGSEQLFTVFYLAATFGAALASSDRSLRLSGVINTALFSLAVVSYYKNFISVWCFFAAIASAMVLVQLRQWRRRERDAQAVNGASTIVRPRP